jgi:hypothetical protein
LIYFGPARPTFATPPGTRFSGDFVEVRSDDSAGILSLVSQADWTALMTFAFFLPQRDRTASRTGRLYGNAAAFIAGDDHSPVKGNADPIGFGLDKI